MATPEYSQFFHKHNLEFVEHIHWENGEELYSFVCKICWTPFCTPVNEFWTTESSAQTQKALVRTNNWLASADGFDLNEIAFLRERWPHEPPIMPLKWRENENAQTLLPSEVRRPFLD